jgi:PAS domain S-box-containing protein
MNFIANTWNSLSSVGLSEDNNVSETKRIKLSNRFGIIAVFFTLPYLVGFFYVGFTGMGCWMCLFSCLYLGTIYFNYLRMHKVAVMILYNTVLVHQFIVASVFGEAAEIHLMYMALMLLPIILYDYRKEMVWIISCLGLTVLAIAVLYLTDFSLFREQVSPEFIHLLNIAYKISTLAGVIVIISVTTVVNDRTEKILDEDKLLLEHQLAVMFDNSFDALFIVETRNRGIIKANRRAAELFEVEKESELYGLRGIDFHKEQLTDADLQKMNIQLVTTGKYESEVLYRTKKNNEFWGALAVRMIHINGKPYQSVRVTDISSLKKVEKHIQASLNEKEILLAEIHHRVKNNLAVVSGLLGMQASYLEDEKARQLFQESRNRIHSMALIHDKLYQHENLAKINFCSYINDLVEHIRESYTMETEVSFSVVCNEIFLDIKYAVPCGLILNELISNSCKHAFKGKAQGEIRIVCTKMGDKFTMAVRDDGVGFDISGGEKKQQSLGMTLISALSEQVGGNVKFARENGTAYYISFEV